VVSESSSLLEKLGGTAKVINGSTRDETIASAKRFIDDLLGPPEDAPPPRRDRIIDSIPGLAWEPQSNVPFYPQPIRINSPVSDVTDRSSPRPPFPPHPAETIITPPKGDTVAVSAGNSTEPPTVTSFELSGGALSETSEQPTAGTATSLSRTVTVTAAIGVEANATVVPAGFVMIPASWATDLVEVRRLLGEVAPALAAIAPIVELIEQGSSERLRGDHNNPPERVAEAGLNATDVRALAASVEVLSRELSATQQHLASLQLAYLTLKQDVPKVTGFREWLLAKGDLLVDELIKSLASGKILVYAAGAKAIVTAVNTLLPEILTRLDLLMHLLGQATH
ncbi:MAG TPA: hypothetical protein VMG55_11710, partial [Stellaceae bacterium]|nr:hypothetical protein [Stellaceae bacterium]